MNRELWNPLLLLLVALNLVLSVLLVKGPDLGGRAIHDSVSEAPGSSRLGVPELPNLRVTTHEDDDDVGTTAPLFHASRTFYVAPAPQPVQAHISVPQFLVSGYFGTASGQAKAYLSDQRNGQVEGVSEGDQIGEWLVRKISRDCVLLTNGVVVIVSDRQRTDQVLEYSKAALLERCPGFSPDVLSIFDAT